MLTLVALTAALARPGEEGELRAELARLESSSASERGAAERWLAAHLEPDDFALVAETAKARGVETRTRIARALGADDGHFELAVLLYVEREPELSAIGTEALAAMAARWFGDSEVEPWNDVKVHDELSGRMAGYFALRLYDEDVDLELDRIARLAPEVNTLRVRGERLSIALDPALYVDLLGSNAPRTRERQPWIEGSFPELLLATVAGYKLGLEGLGFGGAHPWIRVARQDDLGERSALRLLLDWSREVAQFPDKPRGEGAARALASTGWPAPLGWLESRWRKLGDRNALAGLLVAAGRGAMVPGLANAAGVDALIDEIGRSDPRDPSGERRRAAAFHALARMPRIAADGTDLVERVLARGGRPIANAVVVAGIGSAPERYRDEVRARLQRGPLEAGEQLASLRALARTETRALEPWPASASPQLFARLAADRGQSLFLAEADQLAARPADEWREPAKALALDDQALALLIVWWAQREPAVAAKLVAAWRGAKRPLVVLGDTLGQRVRLGDAARIERVLAQARQAGAGEPLAELEILAGLASAEEVAAFAARIAAAPQVPFEAWPVVGEAAGAKGGEALIDVLVEHAKRVVAVDRSLDSPWIDAYGRAMVRCSERNGEPGSREAGLAAMHMRRELSRALRVSQSASKGKTHPLWDELENGRFPPQPGPRAVALEALDLAP